MLAGLLAGLVSAVIAATTMLALANYQFYSRPHVGEVAGSAIANYTADLPSALFAAFVWYVPVGTLVFPPKAHWLDLRRRPSPASEAHRLGGHDLVPRRQSPLRRAVSLSAGTPRSRT
jgi:hypothetical protein